MYHIHQLNKISPKGTELLTENYIHTESMDEAEGVLVRSANMHEMHFSDNLLAVAREPIKKLITQVRKGNGRQHTK